MTKRQIPFEEMESGSVLAAPLPDGDYAYISHNSQRVGMMRAPNPFPWITVLFTFKDGEAQERGHGSSPGDMLSKREVSKVFLVGIAPEQRAELAAKLAESNIELVAA